MLYISIAFFLALIPLYTKLGLGDGIRTPKEIASVLAFVLIIIAGLDCVKKPFKGKILFFFLGWCFVTTIFAMPTPIFFQVGGQTVALNMPGQLFAWKELFYIAIAVFTIYTIATPTSLSPLKTYKLGNLSLNFNLSSYKDEIRSFAHVINYVVIFMCGYAIIQAIGADDFFRTVSSSGVKASSNIAQYYAFTHRIVGTIGNPSLLAEWLAICLPLSLYVGGKKGWVGVILIVIVLSLTFSAGSILAAFIALTFYFFFRYRLMRFIIPIIIAIILTFSFVHKDFVKEQLSDKASFLNPTGRIEIHKEAWNILKQRPLIGIGLGTFENLIGLNPNIVNRNGEQNWRELHDDVGQIWFSTGLIGLALFLGFCVKLFWGFIKNITPETVAVTSCLVAFFLISLVMFPMRVAPLSFYGVVLVGLLLRGVK